MDTNVLTVDSGDAAPPSRCAACFRPRELCFCDAIPSIDNQTDVLIVQHRRERFHAFNSARIVHQSLQRCRLLVDHTPELASQFARTPLSDHAALLYPGDDARLLEDRSPHERVDQLIILDGTWSHAKTLMRDLPRLGTLPRYRLAPSSPSNFRIRREPNAQALSTLEATVAALSVLEPGTRGLDQLMAAFARMIDDQIGHAQSNWRQNRRRRRGVANVPRCLSGDLSDIVVAYGEQQRGGPDDETSVTMRLPIYWVGERLVSGETFQCAIESASDPDPEFLDRLRLSHEDFRGAVSIDTFRRRWQSFFASVGPSGGLSPKHGKIATQR